MLEGSYGSEMARAYLGLTDKESDSKTTWSLSLLSVSIALAFFVGIMAQINQVSHLLERSKPLCSASLFQTIRKNSYWPDLGHVLRTKHCVSISPT